MTGVQTCALPIWQLEDIGFLPGEQVTLLRKGLLKKGPYLVRVGASTFALRHSEARMIEVELVNG